MDPNECLKMIRKLAEEMIKSPDPEDTFVAYGVAIELAELILQLDGWMKRGGFLPKDWEDAWAACDMAREHHMEHGTYDGGE